MKSVTAVTDNDRIRGNPNAPVLVVEYGDYGCPICREADDVIGRLAEEGIVRHVYRHFPLVHFHPNALPAAEAAEAAALQGKFWEMHRELFRHQPHHELADLLRYAETVGLDVPLVAHELETKRFRPAIENDIHEALGGGVSHTPHLFVAGKEFPIAWSADAFTSAVMAAKNAP